ncbi:MAG TPA: SMP-30/gluconolactonase/LRE family protein, partial [Nocardioidaceae bacterium]|nr:SMP-30/gluconolactonase/LRE family protein [Nocardioidaceae bacterium]
GLRFANGVALAADESYVAVAETAGRTVVRHWLSGERAGRTDLLAEDLPGYPDNIARGSDGLVWVTVASPRDPVVEGLMNGPMALRRAAWRLPAPLQPKPKRTARVMAFDDTGGVVHDRSFDATSFHMVTGVREHRGRVWLGSLVEPAVAVFEV